MRLLQDHLVEHVIAVMFTEFGSVIGGIYTFSLTLDDSGSTVIHLSSRDKSIMIKDDAQTIFKVSYSFRKFVYVRSIKPKYDFCIKHGSDEMYGRINNNLTAPSNSGDYLKTA